VSTTQWLLLILLAAVVLYAIAVGVLIAAGRRSEARALAGFIPDCVVLVKRLLGDPRVPRRGKAVLVLFAGDLALPFDLVPDPRRRAARRRNRGRAGAAGGVALRRRNPAPRALARPRHILRGRAPYRVRALLDAVHLADSAQQRDYSGNLIVWHRWPRMQTRARRNTYASSSHDWRR
jgi:hypothetical protein